jgi:type 1 glutamine amidotransferase
LKQLRDQRAGQCLAIAFTAGLFAAGCQTGKPLAPVIDAARPAISEYMPSPAVLVFSGTAGWRHNEGIAGADLFFAELTTEKQYGLFTTENPAVFNAEDLARFELIVFNNATGPILNTEQRAAFQNWMRDGGAWIGLHGAGDSSMADWAWYQKRLIDTTFIGHTMGPQFQEATLVTLAPGHPVLKGVPHRWQHTDEWYSFDRVPSPPGAVPLVGIDESSYEPRNTIVERWPRDLRMGASPQDHPMVWVVCVPEFRAVYSALGHGHETYENADYRRLLANAFGWLLDRSASCRGAWSEQPLPARCSRWTRCCRFSLLAGGCSACRYLCVFCLPVIRRR